MRIAVALMAYALLACAGAAPASKSSTVAEPLPALTLPLLAGGTWASTSAQGKPLVIDVWASWCKPCGKAFPKLNALAARRTDVVVVAITIDEDVAAARDFIAQFPLQVTVAQDTEHALTRAPLSIAQLPALLIVDGDGVIRHRIEEAHEADYDRIDAMIGTP